MDEQRKQITIATAQRIKSLRVQKNLSQEELAFRSGVNVVYYGQLERGLKCPTVDTLYKLSKGLEVPLPELLRFEDEVLLDAKIKNNQVEWLMQKVPNKKVNQVIKILESVVELIE